MGIVVGVGIGVTDAVNGHADRALGDGIGTAVVFVLVLGLISFSLQARDRRKA